MFVKRRRRNLGMPSNRYAPRSISIAAWILTILTCLTAAQPIANADPGEVLAGAARDLIASIRETHYQHKTHVVESDGIYDMDCSGFVDYLLKRVLPERYAQIPIEPGHARPRAAVYYDFFHGMSSDRVPGWEPIEHLVNVKPGDIIAWTLEASAQEGGDTGHVLIAAAPPASITGDEMAIDIYDSSMILHDEDTRPKGTTGIGRGVITFKLDDRGVPVAFRFNSDAHLHFKPIAIARIID